MSISYYDLFPEMYQTAFPTPNSNADPEDDDRLLADMDDNGDLRKPQ